MTKSSVVNPVSSFEVGIIGVSGSPVGMCIKFRYFDGSEALSHWPTPLLARLMQALLEYIETGRHFKFMFKATDDPTLVQKLPARHPYHTLNDEKPDLSSAEVGNSTKNTRVESCSFADQGPTFVVRPVYGDTQTIEIFMHEYTAFSLWGYINEYIEVFDKLNVPVDGPIQ